MDNLKSTMPCLSAKMPCLFCGAELRHVFADLGTSPPSNAFLTEDQLDQPETHYPLKAYVCEQCLLVQGPHFKRPENIFTHEYVYHSSWSRSWVRHAQEFVHMAAERFSLGAGSLIVEIGSNDGYLLQHAQNLGIPCLGIDPSTRAASIAQRKGIHTITDFFTGDMARQLREEGIRADLVCGINVFAHVPSINDFIHGITLLLKPRGVMMMEFPHLLRLVEDVQFDTIYHEHYFYYSLGSVIRMLNQHGLCLFDLEELPTHGGSLRIFAARREEGFSPGPAVGKVLAEEKARGMDTLAFYSRFQDGIAKIRHELMGFLMDMRARGKKVAAYGAAAKGNTLINYFGITKDLLPFVADTSPVKQGLFLPGSRIPVVSEAHIAETRPDYILILPWNLKEEISGQLSYVRDWGGQFVTAIPSLAIF